MNKNILAILKVLEFLLFFKKINILKKTTFLYKFLNFLKPKVVFFNEIPENIRKTTYFLD